MNFRLTKGNFLKTGAYIEGDSAVFTFAAEKEDECSIVLLDKSGNTACELDIPSEYSTGSLYSVRVHGFCGNKYAYYFKINGEEMNSKQIYGILIDVVGLKIKIIIIERSGYEYVFYEAT